MEPEAGGRVYSASVGSLATMCLLARNQRLFIDQKVGFLECKYQSATIRMGTDKIS